jgi:hypothetical protein
MIHPKRESLSYWKSLLAGVCCRGIAFNHEGFPGDAMKLLNRLGLSMIIHFAGGVWRDCKPEHIFS